MFFSHVMMAHQLCCIVTIFINVSLSFDTCTYIVNVFTAILELLMYQIVNLGTPILLA